MKTTLLVIVLLAAGFYAYPLVGEGTGSPCDALEHIMLRKAAVERPAGSLDVLLGQMLQGVSRGTIANVVAQDRYPRLPTGIACTVLYWRTLGGGKDLQPSGIR
jgi:hypothetical protein